MRRIPPSTCPLVWRNLQNLLSATQETPEATQLHELHPTAFGYPPQASIRDSAQPRIPPGSLASGLAQEKTWSWYLHPLLKENFRRLAHNWKELHIPLDRHVPPILFIHKFSVGTQFSGWKRCGIMPKALDLHAVMPSSNPALATIWMCRQQWWEGTHPPPRNAPLSTLPRFDSLIRFPVHWESTRWERESPILFLWNIFEIYQMVAR